MESTLKDIKSKTYGIVSNPTYMSYSLIGLTTFILGYYVFYDKNSSPGSSEAEASPKSEDESAASSALGGMFGSENKDAASEAPSEDASTSAGSENKEEAPSAGLGGMFGSENAEPAASDDANASKPETIGGKRKKTRRQRKQNKSAKSKKQTKQSKK